MKFFKSHLKTSLLLLPLLFSTVITSLCSLSASAIDFNADIKGTAIEPFWRSYNATTGNWTLWRRGSNEASSSTYDRFQVRDSSSSSSTITLYGESVFSLTLQVNNNSSSGCSVSTNGLDSSGITRIFAIENVQTNDNYRKYIVYVLHRSPSNETGIIDINLHMHCAAGATFEIMSWVQYIPSGEILNGIKNYVNNIDTHVNSILQVLEDQSDEQSETNNAINQNRQEGEQAQSEAQNSGASSSTQATGSGQTLLSAFQSFLGALSSVSPGNCNINMDTGYIDFGIVNLCQLSPPPAFQAISSIVVIGFAIPLSIACARKIIELFRSFQS